MLSTEDSIVIRCSQNIFLSKLDQQMLKYLIYTLGIYDYGKINTSVERKQQLV